MVVIVNKKLLLSLFHCVDLARPLGLVTPRLQRIVEVQNHEFWFSAIFLSFSAIHFARTSEESDLMVVL